MSAENNTREVQIDVRYVCSGLFFGNMPKVKKPYTISFRYPRDDGGVVFCPTGDKFIEAEVDENFDSYVNKMGNVEVSCEGCSLCEGGFTGTVRKKLVT